MLKAPAGDMNLNRNKYPTHRSQPSWQQNADMLLFGKNQKRCAMLRYC